MRRLAPAGRRSFSRLGRCRVFQRLHFRPGFLPMIGILESMRSRPDRRGSGLVDSHPRRVSSAVFAGLRSLSRRAFRSQARTTRAPFTPPVESHHFKHGPRQPPGNSPRVSAYGGNVGAICLFVGKNLPGATLQTGRARHRPDRACAAGLGSFCHPAELRGTAQDVHSAQPSRHGEDAASCQLLCAPFTNAD